MVGIKGCLLINGRQILALPVCDGKRKDVFCREKGRISVDHCLWHILMAKAGLVYWYYLWGEGGIFKPMENSTVCTVSSSALVAILRSMSAL